MPRCFCVAVDLMEPTKAEYKPDYLLRDFTNLDFRPLPAGPLVGTGVTMASQSLPPPSYKAALAAFSVGATADIGAYDSGTLDTYWIPGRLTAAASNPVPPHGAVGVRPSADLMFLRGAYATSVRRFCPHQSVRAPTS